MNEPFTLKKINYYVNRVSGAETHTVLGKAEQCVRGVLPLWNKYVFNTNEIDKNVYEYVFEEVDSLVRYEYLFAMDYLSYTVEAYKRTQEYIYKDVTCKYLKMYGEFVKNKKYLDIPYSIFNEFVAYTQTILFTKILDVFGELPCDEVFTDLLLQYADWLVKEENKIYISNHGLFQVIALLHLAQLFEGRKEATVWASCAVNHANKLFDNLYFDDGTNFENSMLYFDFNNRRFEEVISFCNFYGIYGLDSLKAKLDNSKRTLMKIAHRDNSLPLIGDGHIFSVENNINESTVFNNLGLVVINEGKIYLSYKNKTVCTDHAHEDVSSITLRYKDTDIVVDSGQFNYDRFTPINRYVRSTAGHSSFMPLYADGCFWNKLSERMRCTDIYPIEKKGNMICAGGEYVMDDIEATRRIEIQEGIIRVTDKWSCKKPTIMRQRFVLPKLFVENSFFSVSKKRLEARVNGLKVRFEVSSNTTEAFTVCNFGVAAPEYNQYETTLLLDTYTDNSLSGEIITNIYIEEVDKNE